MCRSSKVTAWPRARGWLRWLPLPLYAAVALAMSWPLVGRLDTHVLGQSDHPGLRGDLFYQYDLERQMAGGQFPSHNRIVSLCHPEGLQLHRRDAFALHLSVYAALMTVFDLLPARNIALLLALFASALAMHLLLRRRFGSEAWATLGGLLFAFGPYTFIKVQQGFSQKVFVLFVPLFVLFFLRVIERGRWRDQLLGGLCLLGLLSVYPPYALYGVVLLAPLCLGLLLRSPDRWATARRLLPLTLLCFGAFVALGLSVTGGQTQATTTANFHTLGGYLDPLHPLRFYPYEQTFAEPPADFVRGLPLGVPLLVSLLALVAALRGGGQARWLWLGVIGLLLIMIGPYARLDGSGESSRLVPLPAWLLTQLPGSEAWWFPIRALPWVLCGLLLAGGEALPMLRSWLAGKLGPSHLVVAALAPFLLLVGVTEHWLVFPEYRRFFVTELKIPSFYSGLDMEASPALLLLPPESPLRNVYMLEAVVSARLLVNGYWGGQIRRQIPEGEPSEAEARGLLSGLVRDGVSYIVVYPGLYGAIPAHRRPDTAARLTARFAATPHGWIARRLGPPEVFAEDGMLVFALPGARR